MGSPAAQLIGLTVDIATRSRGDAPVVRTLEAVDVTVGAGRFTALIGESGCGKSLVAAALCGLLPAGSTATGQILVGGRQIGAADESRWRALRGRDIGFVPQSAATSFTPVRTIGAQLAEVCRTLGADRSPAELLQAAHLPVEAGRLYPHELSGGMAQRAAIAAAIAGRPALLIADEPTSALDPGHAAAVWHLLATAAQSGAGVVAITHDLESLLQAEVCDEIALMRAGTVVRQAPTAEMASSSDEYVRAFFDGVQV
ncbi:MAG: transporter ATP-binding protein [Mycobacterium sp.]|nr:transporter ATP-binding protein [Mycobacterium sp.]